MAHRPTRPSRSTPCLRPCKCGSRVGSSSATPSGANSPAPRTAGLPEVRRPPVRPPVFPPLPARPKPVQPDCTSRAPGGSRPVAAIDHQGSRDAWDLTGICRGASTTRPRPQANRCPPSLRRVGAGGDGHTHRPQSVVDTVRSGNPMEPASEPGPTGAVGPTPPGPGRGQRPSAYTGATVADGSRKQARIPDNSPPSVTCVVWPSQDHASPTCRGGTIRRAPRSGARG